MALARCILWHHAQTVPQADPNALLDAQDLARILGAMEPSQREASARQWAQMWGRTFKSLARHLRGEPRRALRLFAQEVYPFLRGDRLAARLDERPDKLWLHDDLPADYLAAMVAQFMAVTGNRATVTPKGSGRFDVQIHTRFADFLPVAMRQLAMWRVPLLFAAFLGAAVGVQSWSPTGFQIMLAAVALQGGANALHDYLQPRPAGPFENRRMNRSVLLAMAVVGHGVAVGIGLWFAWQVPLLWIVGAAGVGASLLYRRIQDHGLGPVIAGLTYGPLLAFGANLASTGIASVHAALLGVPLGALAAGWLYLRDLADRPLDEAGGHRTLLVRLPPQRHVLGFAAILATGTVALWFLSTLAAVVMALASAAMIVSVQQNQDNPSQLGQTRFALLIMQSAIAFTLMELS